MEGVLELLVVDDHEIVCRGVARMLDAIQGLSVVGCAESGGEAIRLARVLRPGAVLIDYLLVGSRVSSEDAIREIHGLLPDARIVVFSGSDLSEDALSALSHAGASSWVSKGAGVEELLDALELPEPAERVKLTAREERVLRVLARGATNEQIADTLGLSKNTIRRHMSALFLKFGVKTRTELALTVGRLRLLR